MLAQRLDVQDGSMLKIIQGAGSVLLAARIDVGLPCAVVRVAAGHASTAALGAMFGPISVEKA